MEDILEIRDIHKSFSDTFTGLTGKEETELSQVLKGVNFSIGNGTITALIGGNGSGKSTLFNIISGLLPANKGSIIYRNKHKNYQLNNLPSFRHAEIGITRLFQGSNIFPEMTVMENMLVADNVRLGEQPWEILFNWKKVQIQEKKRVEEAECILQSLLGKDSTLWKKKDLKAGNRSMGQQRLLAFARLFMNEKAQLFLLDEPCAGVNQLVRETMAELIIKLKSEGKTVLMIEHNTDFARSIAGNAYYLEEGRVALSGEINAVLDSELVQENYFGNKIGKNASVD